MWCEIRETVASNLIKVGGLSAAMTKIGVGAEIFSLGQIIASETEEEIFRILGVPWQEPHERVRG